MDTYTISYWVPGSTSAIPTTVSVQAYDFAQEDGFLVLVDEQGHKVFAVPVSLSPVVTKSVSTP